MHGSTTRTHSYTAFGLVCQSDLPLPELAETTGDPDVLIHSGSIPENLRPRLGEANPYLTDQDHFIMRLDGVACYLVRNGNEIMVEPAPGSNEVEVRLFLYSACFGALLHQRGFLVMHASAIKTGKGAVLFTGTSGVGKSSMLNLFLKRGYTMLSDDITAVSLDPRNCPIAFPAIPRNKLWSGIAARMGYDLGKLPRQRPNEDKYEINTRKQLALQPARLSHIYELNPAEVDDFPIEQLDRMGGFKLILDNIFHQEIYNHQDMKKNNLRLASIVANHVIVRRIFGRMDFSRFDEILDLLEADFDR